MKTQPHLKIKTALTTQTCFHCGEYFKDELVIFEEHSFCCQGCATVFEILQENDLCRYYEINGAIGISPDKNLYETKFDYLDLPEIANKILTFTDGHLSTVNWYIPKMHCSSCIWLLEQLNRLNPAIRSSIVNFPEKTVRITFATEQIKLSDLAKLIAHLGYEPYLSLDDLETKKGAKWNRTRLYKIGVSGFAFGNIMMMSFPEYFHVGDSLADQDLQYLFSVINVALSIPVFFYCASDFFVSAWAGVKAKYLNIDLPIALALLSVYANSLYQVFTNTGSGYFDSLAGAVFFMLLGRYFQDKTYASLSFERNYKSFFPIAISKITEEHEIKIPITELATGDVILIRNEELIPADAILKSHSAHINYSFVTGEAKPVTCKIGDTIYAGGKHLGPAIELEVIKPVSQGYLTELWNNDSFSIEKENQRTTLAARINRYFSASILTLAFFTFIGWWVVGNNLTVAFNAFTTLLLVACPCALLLSATFTNGNLIALFGKYHFYPKNAHAMERLATVDTVVFDKTGTLTLSNKSEVQYHGTKLSIADQKQIKSVVRQSSHPLSTTLYQHLENITTSKTVVSQFEEMKGAGISAYIGQDFIKVGSAKWVGVIEETHAQFTKVFVAINHQVLGFFVIQSKYRPDLPSTINTLNQDGFTTHLLSGDQPTDLAFLTKLFVKESNLHFKQMPSDKLNFIKDLQEKKGRKVLMIGDGLNDAGALSQSNVGVAVSDDSNSFTPSCDAIMEGFQLSQIPGFILLAKAGQRIIKQSFSISLLYNIIGISFAITGQLTPVVAAILMPISSISVVLFTTISTKISANKFLKTDQGQ